MRNVPWGCVVLFAVSVAGTATACGGDNERTADVQMQIKDSADVRIVEYAGVPEVDPHFVLAEEPVYRHGANPARHTRSSPAVERDRAKSSIPTPCSSWVRTASSSLIVVYLASLSSSAIRSRTSRASLGQATSVWQESARPASCC